MAKRRKQAARVCPKAGCECGGCSDCGACIEDHLSCGWADDCNAFGCPGATAGWERLSPGAWQPACDLCPECAACVRAGCSPDCGCSVVECGHHDAPCEVAS